MKIDRERALRVKSLAHEILIKLVQDKTTFNERDLRNVVEMLARSVDSMTDVYAGLESEHTSVLRGTIIKMRIAHNILHYDKKTKKCENDL